MFQTRELSYRMDGGDPVLSYVKRAEKAEHEIELLLKVNIHSSYGYYLTNGSEIVEIINLT